MPLRGLFYISELYKGIYDERKLYSSSLINIPTPHYIVFYNGQENVDDVVTLKLSDAFLNKEKIGCIEVTAKLININYGHNKELMENCRTLSDYSYFISRMRYHLRNINASDTAEKYKAAHMAVNECINQNILADFLTKHKGEVMNMSIFEYDEEEAKEVFKEDGRTEGKAESILYLLEDVGEIPQYLKSRIYSQTDTNTLKAWLKAAAKADSITEFECLIAKQP